MTRSALFTFALLFGTFTFVGCGGTESVDKPPTEDATVDTFEAMSEAEQAEYDKQMAQEMGN